MFGNSNESIHAKQLWNHLDKLAEENPEEYKRFINTQLTNGKDMFFDNKNYNNVNSKTNCNPDSLNFNKDEEMLQKIFTSKFNQNSGYEVKVYPYTVLRFKINKLINLNTSKTNENIITSNPNNKLSQNDINEIPKIIFSSMFSSETKSNKAILHSPKVYLNIVYSDDFYPPINNNNKEEGDYKKWNYIPTLFRPSGTKNSMTNIECLIYDCVINTKVYKECNNCDRNKSQILSHIVRKFSIFINCYCELHLKNVKLLSNHKYKGTTSLPSKWLIGQSIKNKETATTNKFEKSKNFNYDNNENNNKNTNNSNSNLFKEFKEENKIIIPSSSENMTNQSSFYNLPKNNKLKNNNKILIQEIKEENKTNIKSHPLIKIISKKILNDKELEAIFKFENFSNNDNINIDTIDLQISEDEMIIKIDNKNLSEYTPVFLSFENKFKINNEKCKAKYNPNTKELRVVLTKYKK